MWFLVMEEEEEETTPRRAHLHRMRAWCVMYWSAEPGEERIRKRGRSRESKGVMRIEDVWRERGDERGPPLCRADCPFMLCFVCVVVIWVECGEQRVAAQLCVRADIRVSFVCRVVSCWRRARVIVLRLGRLESFASRAPLMDKLSVAVGAVCVGAGRSL